MNWKILTIAAGFWGYHQWLWWDLTPWAAAELGLEMIVVNGISTLILALAFLRATTINLRAPPGRS